MIKLNKAYVYDPVTREFVGVARLDHDPLSGGWLMPANAVQVKPDVANCPDNKTLVLSDDGAKWVAVEDYRGEVIYRVADGHPAQVNGLGTLSADVTLIKPEPEEGFLIDQFDEKSKKWLYRKNFAGMVVYSTADGAPRTLTIDDRAIPDGYTDKSRQNDAYNWDAKSSDWVLDKAKQAELDTQAAQAAFEQAKAAKTSEINVQAQAYIDHATGADQLPAFEVQSWTIQGAEAKAWKADPTTPTPTLGAIAKARCVPLDALRAGAYKKTMMYEAVVASVTGQRQKYNDQLRAAKTLTEIDAINVVYG